MHSSVTLDLQTFHEENVNFSRANGKKLGAKNHKRNSRFNTKISSNKRTTDLPRKSKSHYMIQNKKLFFKLFIAEQRLQKTFNYNFFEDGFSLEHWVVPTFFLFSADSVQKNNYILISHCSFALQCSLAKTNCVRFIGIFLKLIESDCM